MEDHLSNHKLWGTQKALQRNEVPKFFRKPGFCGKKLKKYKEVISDQVAIEELTSILFLHKWN